MSNPAYNKYIETLETSYNQLSKVVKQVANSENGDGNEKRDAPSERDSFFEEAARIIVEHQQGSASLLQRKLKLGYNRAGSIVDQLEAAGIIGSFEDSKAREVLIKDMLSLEKLLNKSDKN